MFSITLLSSYRNRHPKTFKRCQSCKVDLPHPQTIDPPLNIIMTHQERYEYFDSKKKETVWSPKEAEAPLHAQYDCIVKRYPFFSVHLIKIPTITRNQLTDAHRQWLNCQFGYPI
jgi:hypothetical protein